MDLKLNERAIQIIYIEIHLGFHGVVRLLEIFDFPGRIIIITISGDYKKKTKNTNLFPYLEYLAPFPLVSDPLIPWVFLRWKF